MAVVLEIVGHTNQRPLHARRPRGTGTRRLSIPEGRLQIVLALRTARVPIADSR
jgi:hypothetical protein